MAKGKVYEVDKRVMFDSEAFDGVSYYVKDRHLLVRAGINGNLCIDLQQADEFCREVRDIAETYKNVRT